MKTLGNWPQFRSAGVLAGLLVLIVFGTVAASVAEAQTHSNALAALQSVSVNPSTVTGGQDSTGTVKLTKAAPSGGVLVSLTSSNAAAHVGSSVTVRANATSATFNITTSPVSTSTPATISGVYKGVTKTATLTVGVSAPTELFSANPPTIGPNQSSTLSWITHNATAVTINGDPVGLSSSESVSPTTTTTYTLTATGSGGGMVTSSVTVTVGAADVQHLVYVVVDQTLYVYDLDSNFELLKTVSIPQVQGVRGVGAVPGTNTLYISYGYDGTSGASIPPGSLLAYDLLTDTVMSPQWPQTYPSGFGVDSFAITPDGTTIYMPMGASSGSGIWHILSAANGSVEGSINTGGSCAHDTVASLDGAYVFMGPHSSTWWAKAQTSNNTVVLDSATLKGGIGPFTVNGKHTLLFSTETGYFGFQVTDATTGALLYTVPVSSKFAIPPGFNPSHGISLSPDEKQIYLIDTANAYAHVFDVSGLPSTAPTEVADIPLGTSFTGDQSPCLYDCEREGWMLHTRDGQYVIVGDSGAVISTSSQTVVATLPELSNTRIYLEIDFENGSAISTTTRQGMGYGTQ
jgi:hypothetical protein